jgi:choline dehydrogenase-like flavoprotein
LHGCRTPQLLELSGIGPADHLRARGIPVIADLAGVGANLSDHPLGVVIYSAAQPMPTATHLPDGLLNPRSGKHHLTEEYGEFE